MSSEPQNPPGNGGSALLGKNTKFASPLAKRHENRLRRFFLQVVARETLGPLSRISICHRWVRSGEPEIWYSEETRIAHYKNLMVCGVLWLCPVCAAKITERRKNEIALAMRGFPGTVFLSTFTLQHRLENKLSDLAKDLNDVYREMKSGKGWILFEKRWGIVGSIRSFEVTVSKANGWHPHIHTLFFSTKRVDELHRETIQNELEKRFIDLMAKKGRYVMQNLGVEVEKGMGAMENDNEALKLYVGKWGLSAELAKGSSKTGDAGSGAIHYSPFQLLDLVAMGDQQAKEWFLEYAKAIKGVKQLVWSKGLRELLGLSKEKTDKELAEEKESTGFEDKYSVKDFGYVRIANKQPVLLNIREREGKQAVIDFVQALKRIYIQHYQDRGLEMAGYEPPPKTLPDGPGGP